MRPGGLVLEFLSKVEQTWYVIAYLYPNDMKNQKYKRLENYCEGPIFKAIENRVKMAVRNFSMALKMSPLKKEKALNNDWKCFKFLFYVLQKNLS